MTRVVLDASVLASVTVAHPNSPSARLLDAAKEREIQVVACAELIAELDRALSRRYFTERLTEKRAVVRDADRGGAGNHAARPEGDVAAHWSAMAAGRMTAFLCLSPLPQFEGSGMIAASFR